MHNAEMERLREELAQFKKEKEQIRMIIGGIGGNNIQKRDKILNMLFIGVIVILFAVDFARHALGFHVPIPALLTIEMGVLVVSIKIIWMMHKQMKVEHFQFWILSSIEFRVNDIGKKVIKIEERLMRHLHLKLKEKQTDLDIDKATTET